MHAAYAPCHAATRPGRRLAGKYCRRSFALIGLSTLLGTIGFASNASADDTKIIRVEEDWRVEIGTPSPSEHAPQIVTVMSPLGHLEGPYAIFELNHSTYPDFAGGGMQLQKWFNEANFGYRNFPNYSLLNKSNEVIEFTTRMEITDGDLIFEIRNGTSETWSSFGGQGYLKIRYNYLPVSNLNSYQPEVSTKNSRIGFASHRVKKLMLKEVRRYSSEGLYLRDETDRVVHEHVPE